MTDKIYKKRYFQLRETLIKFMLKETMVADMVDDLYDIHWGLEKEIKDRAKEKGVPVRKDKQR